MTDNPHILVVTGVDANRRYSLECPGVTSVCSEYAECDCPESKTSAEWDNDTWFDWTGETEAHGVEHQYLDYCWMKPTGRCYLVNPPEGLAECFDDDDLDALAPGRYPVYHEFDEECTILSLIKPVEAGAVRQ